MMLYSLESLQQKLNKIQDLVELHNLEVDVPSMFHSFHEQYKLKNGDYRHLAGTPKYVLLMNAQDDWVFQQMKEVIDCKISEVILSQRKSVQYT